MNLQELHESTLPSAYRPSEFERIVLAKIIVAETPQLANDSTSRGMQLNAAKEQLITLGFVEALDGEVSLTTDGEELSVAQALMDDSGEPTDNAAEIAATEVT